MSARTAIPAIAPAAFHRRRAGTPVVALHGKTMGTTWSAKLVGGPEDVAARIAATLDGVIADMSQWVPTSALSRFNAGAVGAWQALPANLLHVLDAALAIGQSSDGTFDPAAGALADLWGFGPPGPRRDIPDDAAIDAAMTHSGCDAIERQGDRARRTRDVALDLSGIAKGFAVDALADTLATAGVDDFLVEIGGEFVGRGIKPDGQPWWIALEAPPGVALAPLHLALHDRAVATSGDYRRFIAQGGRRLGHTIDPRTGRPTANGVVSVSVIAADCMRADGWATALTVAGPERGMAIAEREGLVARIVTADGRERLSPALAAMIA